MVLLVILTADLVFMKEVMHTYNLQMTSSFTSILQLVHIVSAEWQCLKPYTAHRAV